MAVFSVQPNVKCNQAQYLVPDVVAVWSSCKWFALWRSTLCFTILYSLQRTVSAYQHVLHRRRMEGLWSVEVARPFEILSPESSSDGDSDLLGCYALSTG